MESELPIQKNCFVHFIAQIFGKLKLGKITIGLGLKLHCVPKNCLQK